MDVEEYFISNRKPLEQVFFCNDLFRKFSILNWPTNMYCQYYHSLRTVWIQWRFKICQILTSVNIRKGYGVNLIRAISDNSMLPVPL